MALPRLSDTRFLASIVLGLVAMVLLAGAAGAQGLPDEMWRQLQAAPRRAIVQLILVGPSEVEGRLVEVQGDRLIIDEVRVIRGRIVSTDGTVTVARADIVTARVSGASTLAVSGSPEVWSNLQQLRIGLPIEVVRSDSATVVGTLAGVSDSGIAVYSRQVTITVPRALVRRVHVLQEGRQGGQAALGLAIGAAAGFAVGMVIDCSRLTEHCSGLVALLIGMPVGAAAGGLMGMAAGRYPLAYRAPIDGAPASGLGAVSAAEPPAEAAREVVVAVDMWTNVLKLADGDRIRIRLADGRTVTGRVRQTSGDGVLIADAIEGQDPAAGRMVPRASVAAIHSFAGAGFLMGRGDKRALIYDRTAPGARLAVAAIVGAGRRGVLMTVRF